MSELPIVLYSTPDGRVVVNALVKDETLWMTQAGMAELFGVTPQSITYHLKNIHQSGELDEAATCKEILQVACPIQVRTSLHLYLWTIVPFGVCGQSSLDTSSSLY